MEPAIGIGGFDFDAIGEQAPGGAVAFEEGGAIDEGELADGGFDGVLREGGVEALEGLAEAAFEDDVAEVGVGAFGGRRVVGYVGAVEDGPVLGFEPG